MSAAAAALPVWVHQLDSRTALTSAYVDVYLFLSKSSICPPADIGRRAHEAVVAAVAMLETQTSAEEAL